jgi:hypothetical protein
LHALKDTSAQGGAGRTRLRSVLVVAQIAISLVVLIAAGLVVRTLQQSANDEPGFDPKNALTMSFDLSLQGYDEARGQQFYKQLAERVRALPGVKSAAASSYIPLSLNYNSRNIYVEGEPIERAANMPLVDERFRLTTLFRNDGDADRDRREVHRTGPREIRASRHCQRNLREASDAALSRPLKPLASASVWRCERTIHAHRRRCRRREVLSTSPRSPSLHVGAVDAGLHLERRDHGAHYR